MNELVARADQFATWPWPSRHHVGQLVWQSSDSGGTTATQALRGFNL